MRAARARGPLRVLATPRGAAAPVEGKLSFIDSAVDAATGAVTLKARFENADQELWPGQFADVRLAVGRREGAVVVAARAVQPGQGGDRLFVVGDDGTAQSRVVKLGPRAGEGVVVEEGVAAGERVVVDGLLGLAPGAKVEVRQAAKPAGSQPETAARAPAPGARADARAAGGRADPP